MHQKVHGARLRQPGQYSDVKRKHAPVQHPGGPAKEPGHRLLCRARQPAALLNRRSPRRPRNLTRAGQETQLPRRRCGCCKKITTATAPHAQAGSVVYGPNINAAAVLLSSEGNVPVERTAALMEALLGTPVSSGFVARALAGMAAGTSA